MYLNTAFSVAANVVLFPRRHVVLLEGDGGHESRLPVDVVGHDHEAAVGKPNLILAVGAA